MPVVSSVLLWEQFQRDARRYIRERHTDHLGVAHLVDYLAPAGTDATATMLARVSVIEAQLADAEIAANLADIQERDAGATPTVQHATLAQVRQAIREAFRTATRTEALAIGAFLGTLTNAQLKALFGLTDAQTTALRTKVTNMASLLSAVKAQAGE